VARKPIGKELSAEETVESNAMRVGVDRVAIVEENETFKHVGTI